MLEIGKLYVVKSVFYTWLFKKSSGLSITTFSRCLCLDDNERWEDGGRICDDSQIEWIKPASRNYIVIWNRIFNDNIEIV